MRTVLLLLSIVVLMHTNYSCRQNTPALQEDTLTKTVEQKKLEDDMVDIELFVDSLVSQKDMIFSTQTIDAGQVKLWDEKWGPSLKEPYCIEFGSKEYKLKNASIVFGHENLKEGVYHIDTALKFSMKGKEYYLASGSYYNCNGSGCGYSIYFLLDKQRQRLHLFEMFRQPASRFLGDINNDGELDIMVQDYVMTPEYDRKNAVLALYPFTLDDKGYFVRMKGGDGAECFLLGECDAEWYPERFRIVGYNCTELEIKRY